jgi:hypothetical protein
MARLFYPAPLPGLEIHPVFHYRHQVDKGGGLFRNIDYAFFERAEVRDIGSAEAIVLPNNFAKEPTAEARAYITQHADEAERVGKPIFIFSCGDWSDTIRFDPRVYVFRQSLYRATMGPRDICIPTTTEDPPPELLFIRDKEERPLVAFCGQGGFATMRRWMKYFAENILADIHALWDPHARARKIGVYWRRAMMRACTRSKKVRTNFIVRRTFSGHAKSIELDPKVARQQYLKTSANADFVLAPKGDGNYSNRFLKTLAFGRIPVAVDTDIVLPLEEVIPYERLMVRVPMNEVGKTADHIARFYDALSNNEWKERQKEARETFLAYLVQEKFFEYYFTKRMPV